MKRTIARRSRNPGTQSRRSFLLGMPAAAISSRLLRGQNAVELDPGSISARRKAAWRSRPLIVDDDGDLVYDTQTLEGPEAFQSLRLEDYRESGVNSVAWCMMWGIARQGATPTRYWQTQMKGVPFQENLPDPTPAVEHFCRENEIEVFGSIRMNDCHDAFGLPFPKLVYPLKVAHPEMLLGNESHRGEGPEAGLEAAMWSGLNFEHEPVRRDRLWWIENTAKSYDLDGVDLNFFRMPFYFKLGEEEKNLGLMTGLIREARKRLDAIGRERGRPVLLGVRTPGTVEACLRIGLDIETWLQERLVDRVLSGGGYVCYSTPADELVKLGHRFDVPVYPCINCPASYELGQGNLRAAASNLWRAGADGIYLWNFQYIPAPGSRGYGRPAAEQYTKHLPEMADPNKLKYLDKSFAVNHGVWVQYQRASAPAPLPVAIGAREQDGARSIPIRIGDDIAAAHCIGKLRDVVLRLETSGAIAGDAIGAKMNDSPTRTVVGDRENRFEVALEPGAIRQGVNQLGLEIMRRGSSAFEPVSVEGVRVDVRYQNG